jgi:hypothetical protein
MVYEEDINFNGLIGNQIPDELTWISECEGNLDLSRNDLTTLEGCPEIVLGDISIEENRANLLLLGFPKQVGSDKISSSIDLSNSQITGLKYLPRLINGSLKIANCSLKSLEDCPQHIKGDFDIQSNHLITTLEGGPTNVGGIYKCFDTSVTNFIHAPINPDFGGFITQETITTTSYKYRYVESWAGFKPALNHKVTALLIDYVEKQYQLLSKSKPVFTNDETRFIMKLGAYLEIRKSKPELDTSIEAREEFAAYNPTSLEDLKAKSDTKQYEGVDINYVKMLKKALLK